MKRSPLKRKPVDYAELLAKQAFRKAKSTLKVGTPRIKSRKHYYKDILFDSTWELEGYKELEYRVLAKEITDLDDHVTVTYKVFNEAGDYKQFQINIDFQYFDKNLNRWVRKDRKSSKKLVKKNQEGWLLRWEMMKFAEPDFQYELEYMR